MIAPLTLSFALLAGPALATEPVTGPQAEPAPLPARRSVEIPFDKYTLDNGLDVILAEDHSVPFVQVNIWYDVGSKDEEPGRTGFAHLFEHLMFQGSAHMDDDYFVPLQPIGAQVNGSTNLDRTNFFEGVPSEYLPLALWLESDRMGWLLPAFNQAKLDEQREVVRNERRQRYENRPYGEVWIWLYENLFPEDHPYHVPTIGRHDDLEAATVDDVAAFFRTWYLPNNASLTICGDFDPDEARTLVDRYFGDIPAGEQPQPVRSYPLPDDWLSTEKVVEETDDVPHAKVWLAWITPALYQEGDAALDTLSSVLSDGKDSRLYRRLVHDQQIARDVSAYQVSNRLQSVYMIEATAAEGHTTDELVESIDVVLDELREQGPSPEEVEIAKINWQVRFFQGLQTIARKADILNGYNVVTGDPGYIDQDLQRYLDVDADDVRDAVDTWLGHGRLVLHVRPEGGAQ